MSKIDFKILVAATLCWSPLAKTQEGLNWRIVQCPKFRSEAGMSQVQGPVFKTLSLSNKECLEDADKLVLSSGVAASNAANAMLSDNNSYGSSRDAASAAKNAMDMGAGGNGAAAELCVLAQKSCATVASSATANLEKNLAIQKKNLGIYSSQPDAASQQKAQKIRMEIMNIEADIADVATLKNECTSVFGAKAATFGMSSSEFAKNSVSALGTVNALTGIGGAASDGGKMSTGMAVGLGAVGALALKSIFSDGGGGGGSGSEDLAKAAAADPQCQSARAYEFDHCQKYMREYLCNNPATMNDARCEKWSNNYCGFGTPKTDGNGSPVAAPGLGTQVCKDNLAYRYCQKAERVGCYSCLNLRDRAQPTCQRQPAACATTVSDADMGRYRAQCPDDPVFTDPRWAGIQASTGTTPAGQPPTTNTVSGNSVGQNSSANSIIGGGGQRQTSSVNGQSVPDDIGGRFNGSVLAQASGAYKSLCDQGQLNNCGPRANINR